MSAGLVVLSARGVAVEAGGRRILHDLDLDVRSGEVLALVGPNGAGKSTLLGVLSGEATATAGVVEIDGRPIGALRPLELARRRAVLTQENLVSFPFPVRDVVHMGRAPWRRTEAEDRDDAAVLAAAAAADVTELLDRRVTDLSGGERARASLARVLAQETPIVILDEPTAALDLRHQEDVLRLARRLAADGGAVVVVLHDLSLAGSVADRVAVLEAGRIRAVGTPREVLTAELIRQVYRTPVDVIEHAGRLLVAPRSTDPTTAPL